MLLGRKPIGTVAYMGGVMAVPEEFCWSLAQLLIYSHEALCTDKQYIHIDRVRYSDHGPARNALANGMLGDWLLMLDTDHAPPPDMLVRLYDRAYTRDLDVVTGIYRFKSPPHTPVLYAADEGKPLLPIARYPRDVVFRVGAAGAGCLFVKKTVFDRIAVTGEEPFDRRPGLSEDHSFFRRLQELGIHAWCDPRVECPHLRVVGVREEDRCDEGYVVSEPFGVPGVT